MMRARSLTLILLFLAAASARAEPRFLVRMATVAPDGTGWARELKAFARSVESLTSGQVRVRWYLGGIAGGEHEMAERVRRGQLDGLVSGGPLCQRLAPSLRPLQLPGLFQNRGEAAHVMNRLRSLLDQEFLRAGYANLGELSLGPGVIFSRAPIRTIADARRLRIWVWDALDPSSYRTFTDVLGMQTVPLPMESAARAYDEQRVDAFLAVPTAALAFQWSTQARYVLDLPVAYAVGCLVVSSRAFDALPIEFQRALHDATAQALTRLNDLGQRQDDALLGGVLERQGLVRVRPSEALRAEFFQAARVGRERLGPDLIPPALLERVLGMLADYRGEHRE